MSDGDRYLIAAELVGKTMAAIGVENYCVVKTVKGSELEGMVFKHPIFDRDSVLVHANYVTLEDGTGVVHTAPGHGREDFETGQRYGLKSLNPVDGKGCFTKDAGQFEGLHITKQGNQAVLEALQEAGSLLAESEIAHSYPHCWRCHKPVVFRTTVQWFMARSQRPAPAGCSTRSTRSSCYPAEAQQPASGDDRELAGLVPFAAEVVGRRHPGLLLRGLRRADDDARSRSTRSTRTRSRTARTRGSRRTPSEFLPAGFKCPKCGGDEFTKEDGRPGRVVRLGFELPGGDREALRHVPCRRVSRRLRPAPGMVQQVAWSSARRPRASRRSRSS